VLRELQKKKLHAQSMWVLAHMIVWIAKTSVCAEGFALGSAFINSSRGFESPVIIGDHDFWARRLVPGGDNGTESVVQGTRLSAVRTTAPVSRASPTATEM
jgi:hypothetical protein